MLSFHLLSLDQKVEVVSRWVDEGGVSVYTLPATLVGQATIDRMNQEIKDIIKDRLSNIVRVHKEDGFAAAELELVHLLGTRVLYNWSLPEVDADVGWLLMTKEAKPSMNDNVTHYLGYVVARKYREKQEEVQS